MTTPIAPQAPWWLDRTIILPILYTLFGACLGFAAGRLRDWLDERNARKSFLAAVRAELATISEHLTGTLKDAMQCKEALDKGEHQVLHLATTFQTAIYTSQVGKLKSVADSLLIEVIRFYDTLSNLERVKSRLTLISYDVLRLTETPEDIARTEPMVADYRTALEEVIKRINKLIPAAQSLLARIQEE